MTAPRYRQKPGVHVRQVDDQAFLADPDTDVLFHLNSIGTAVWRLLEQPITADEITGLLVDAFPDAGKEQITGDVSSLLNHMTLNGLVFSVEAT